MKLTRDGCPLCSGACRVVGTADQGKEVELACANCTIFRITTDAAALLLDEPGARREMYAVLARRCPADHVILISASASDLAYDCIAIRRLKALKVHPR